MNKESTKKIGLWNIVGLGVGGENRTFHFAHNDYLRFLYVTGLLV